MKIVEYWVVSVVEDSSGKNLVPIKGFDKEQLAIEFSHSDQGRDMFRRPGTISKCIIKICESLEDAGVKSNNIRRVEALAKLTDADKAVLGLLSDSEIKD